MEVVTGRLSPQEVALLVAAREAGAHAYAPYSDFHVGAAVRGASGSVYPGCNIENASYGLTLCAEQVAVARAVSSGERTLVAAAVVADGRDVPWPCGRCRQTLAQFGPRIAVLCEGPDGAVYRSGLDELLPHGFTDEAFA